MFTELASEKQVQVRILIKFLKNFHMFNIHLSAEGVMFCGGRFYKQKEKKKEKEEDCIFSRSKDKWSWDYDSKY